MIGKIALLALIAFADARPNKHNTGSIFTEPHDACPTYKTHHLLPHEYDCTKFYYCEYGQKWIEPRDCAPGTVFSFELQVCIHPIFTECYLPGYPHIEPQTESGENEIGNGNGSSEVNQPEVDQPEASNEAQNSEEADDIDDDVNVASNEETQPESNVDGSDETKPESNEVENETEGNQTESSPIDENDSDEVESTPEVDGNGSDEVESTPEVDGNGSDEDQQTESSPDVDQTESSTEVEGGNGNGEESSEDQSTPDQDGDLEGVILENGCPADWDVHKLLPHETQCNLFYYCNFGEKVLRQCAEGTYFNYEIQVCDHPENVDCASGTGSGSSSGETDATTPGNGNSDENTGNTDENPDNTEENNVTSEETVGNGEDNNVSSEEFIGNGAQSEETVGNGEENNVTSEEAVDNGDGNESIEWLENGCPANGEVAHLVPDKDNCAKFYICDNGALIESQCPSGLHFNVAIQACDWPSSAGCQNSAENSSETEANGNSEEANVEENGNGEEPDVDGNGNGEEPDVDGNGNGEEPDVDGNGNSEEANVEGNGNSEENIEWLENGCPSDWHIHHLLPHESECGKFYYCVHGNLVERECPEGTHFNPSNQVCDWPWNAGCQNGDSGNSGENNNSEENNVTTEENSNTDNSNEDNTDNGDGAENVPEENGNSDENNETGNGNNSSEDNNNVDGGNTDDNSQENNVNSQENGQWLENGCPSDWQVHQLLPHESECGKFYYCVHGNLVERDCPAGTHFNPVLQVCDWPANAGCQIGGNGNSEENNAEENGNSEENNGNNSGNNSAETDNTEDNNGSNQENNVDSEENNAASEENNATTEENNDNNGGNNSEEDNVDNGNNNSGENNNVDENGNSEENSQENGQWLENGCPSDWQIHQLLPHESECGKFYYCVHGNLVERDCPAGTHFNPVLQVCDWPSNAGCINGNGNSGENTDENQAASEESTDNSNETGNTDENNGNSDENNGNTDNGAENNSVETLENGCPADWNINQLMPHETECGKFYICDNGQLVEMECSGGLHFNPAEQSCDWPENVGCLGAVESNSEENNDEDNNTTETDNNSGENNSEEANNTDENEIVEEIEPDHSKCQECNAGDWAHETDCDKFWRCEGDRAILGVCAEGLHFNVNTKTCDFICNAGCTREYVSATFERDGTRLFVPWSQLDKKTMKSFYKNLHV